MLQKRTIFRQAALDRLSSPEQLDRMMQVTTPKGWIALIALCCVIATAVGWSVYGRIPTVVQGSGMLIRLGGLLDVDATGAGMVSEMMVEEGDFVEVGQVIARMAQPQLQQQIAQGRADLAVRRLALENRETRGLGVEEAQIGAAERRLQALELQLDQHANVISAYAGKILKIRVDEGQMVQPGMAIVSLEKADAPLQVAGFLPMVGQKLMPHMVAQVSPVTVKREAHGYMVGNVLRVSGLPVTQAGMMRLLNNELLVAQISAQGASFRVDIDLARDAQTVSGFRWSSGRGPSMTVESGTLCDVRVVVDEQRPIELVIPMLSRLLLGESSRFSPKP